MKTLLAATAVLVSVLSSANAASICKGLEKPACDQMVFENVPVCRWQVEYYTTGGIRGNFCTTSGKKIQDADQFQRLQAALPALKQQAITGNSSN